MAPQLSPPLPITTVGSTYSSSPKSLPVSAGLTKRSFTYQELVIATDNFSAANLLGEGGFSHVYKGTLSNGTEAAIKRLKDTNKQTDVEFMKEADILSLVHHRHLVSLIGCCISEGNWLLVCEYVPNKTLKFHLQDFGIAKYSSDEKTHISTVVKGTYGYLSPEYVSTGQLTDKSDVFSYGVLLLELITGRRPIGLADWEKGKGADMKPSTKKRSRRKKRKPAPAIGSDPPEEEEAAASAAEILVNGGGDDEQRRALKWLIDAFSSVSVDQIASAFREAGGYPFKAAGILGAQLDDPAVGPAGGREAMGSGNGFAGSRKHKRVAAATGMVSDVIGKGYTGGGRRNKDRILTHLQSKGRMNRMYSGEEAEQFLCSMLGDDSELGMGVVRDVLGN
ncbi:hypothetical protein B296_00014698 [Ensete ventricosum]|uniref:non-specific serine/threonine protein kinase n=1 Tax=Ensete ventricosum TaxID=4639 RepID=A0A426ZRD3_ENSVE|nr:hypothetical protein B296_00014698 [Ensete ventricosum]